ncbi:hypothetical protein N7488_004479 [Penicillium malachiteum]|nr:hypothetical protein N7488_004479 [Penicillium malachiteum]
MLQGICDRDSQEEASSDSLHGKWKSSRLYNVLESTLSSSHHFIPQQLEPINTAQPKYEFSQINIQLGKSSEPPSSETIVNTIETDAPDEPNQTKQVPAPILHFPVHVSPTTLSLPQFTPEMANLYFNTSDIWLRILTSENF